MKVVQDSISSGIHSNTSQLNQSSLNQNLSNSIDPHVNNGNATVNSPLGEHPTGHELTSAKQLSQEQLSHEQQTDVAQFEALLAPVAIIANEPAPFTKPQENALAKSEQVAIIKTSDNPTLNAASSGHTQAPTRQHAVTLPGNSTSNLANTGEPAPTVLPTALPANLPTTGITATVQNTASTVNESVGDGNKSTLIATKTEATELTEALTEKNQKLSTTNQAGSSPSSQQAGLTPTAHNANTTTTLPNSLDGSTKETIAAVNGVSTNNSATTIAPTTAQHQTDSSAKDSHVTPGHLKEHQQINLTQPNLSQTVQEPIKNMGKAAATDTIQAANATQTNNTIQTTNATQASSASPLSTPNMAQDANLPLVRQAQADSKMHTANLQSPQQLLANLTQVSADASLLDEISQVVQTQLLPTLDTLLRVQLDKLAGNSASTTQLAERLDQLSLQSTLIHNKSPVKQETILVQLLMKQGDVGKIDVQLQGSQLNVAFTGIQASTTPGLGTLPTAMLMELQAMLEEKYPQWQVNVGNRAEVSGDARSENWLSQKQQEGQHQQQSQQGSHSDDEQAEGLVRETAKESDVNTFNQILADQPSGETGAEA